MDLEKVLAQLRTELRNLDAAILSLERIQQRAGRRGRPPAWLANLKNQQHPRGGKKHDHANPSNPPEP